MKKRGAGVLMPIFSLPGEYGIGTLGEEARRFADFLRDAGQSYWQILPLGPTGYGDSPYQSFSTFAGNPYFINLPKLVEQGLITKEECDAEDFGDDPRRVSYEKLYYKRFPLFERACGRFFAAGAPEGYEGFLKENEDWLDGYARFMERKEGRPADLYRFLQYVFSVQWKEFREYVNAQGIEIIGDIPIYVSEDSSDMVDHPELFQLDKDGRPSAVAGCPPDAFASDGQLWGNPLYDWDYHKKTAYRWWIRRMERCFSLCDIVRVDHFRGFDEYYSIPAGSTNARNGKWVKGPGISLFKALKEALGEDRQIIAEDLGYVTDSVRKLVEDTGYPGMKLLQFAFDSREEADYRPSTWTENCVAYTGTHDNQTAKAWFDELTEEDRQMAADYLHESVEELAASDYVGKFIGITMDSVADTAIIPMQDYLRLGAEARVNAPSTLGPQNWSFRFLSSDFTDALCREIREVTEKSGRINRKKD